VFLGNSANPDLCGSPALQSDSDQDGVSDYCENLIGPAFAPLLAFGQGELNSGAEPRWVLQPYGDPYSWDRVRIGYLLSYYVDGGSDNPNCHFSYAVEACRGHYGDSESIWLDVQYNWTSHHWVLLQAGFSKHDSWGGYYATRAGYPPLTYPSHPGAYPLVYASVSKHANYASLQECDAGGFMGSDYCGTTTYWRVPVTAALNLGSRTHQQVNCVSSVNPVYAQNPPECYWTGLRFDGWQNGAQPDSDPYNDKLILWGF